MRIFPFGGTNVLTTMRGETLRKALDQGAANKGSGGLLHHANIARDESGAWRLGGRPIEPGTEYKVLLADYLTTGQEKGLSFLNPDAPGSGVKRLRTATAVRDALAAGLAPGRDRRVEQP